MQALQTFGVVGAGAWGTALAAALARAGRDVLLWAREAEVAAAIDAQQENAVFLPGVKLDPRIRATNDLKELAVCHALLLVAPAQHTRSLCAQLDEIALAGEAPLLLCAKGIEMGTLKLPSIVVGEALPGRRLAVLSGPSFAREVALDQPTALTLACADESLGKALAQAIGSRAFRPYLSDDVKGAQIGGAIKNVLAVATGIAAGLRMGENARAALITRGLAEMMRLGLALGARPETLMGLSGLGDLTLTCSSEQSRNMSLGLALGQGRKLAAILAERKTVAEGVPSAAAAAALADLYKVDMPIVAAVDAVLNREADVEDAVASLLSRPLKMERDVV